MYCVRRRFCCPIAARAFLLPIQTVPSVKKYKKKTVFKIKKKKLRKFEKKNYKLKNTKLKKIIIIYYDF